MRLVYKFHFLYENMKTLDLAVLFVLFVLLGIGIYFFWSNTSGDQSVKSYSQFVMNVSENALFQSSQFYLNMRFAKREISYRIEEVCGNRKNREIQEAFSLIAEKTRISFYPVSNNAEIDIICSDEAPQEDISDKQFYIAGEGGPTEARNLTTGYLILKGKVSLFKDEKCDEPKLAVHEILHVLGFDHNNNPKSVMYPVTHCDQSLDEYISNEINRLYAQDTLPDLTILKINATRSSYGVSFKISVINAGFKEAINSKIELFSGINRIANYSFGVMQPGMINTLEVKNLRTKKSDNSVKFLVLYGDNGEELSYDNNLAELFLLEENN